MPFVTSHNQLVALHSSGVELQAWRYIYCMTEASVYKNLTHNLNFGYATSSLTTVKNHAGFLLKLGVLRRKEFGHSSLCETPTAGHHVICADRPQGATPLGDTGGRHEQVVTVTEITTPPTPPIGPWNLGLVSYQSDVRHLQSGK